jgi:hypothetical protein
LNLLGNSIKYRSSGRPLKISITTSVSHGPVHTAGQPQFYKVSVTDNGIGFQPEQAGKIFEIFQRLHRRDQYPGTGIGLAICRKVMECHKGYIVGRGITDGGASFDCYFPV